MRKDEQARDMEELAAVWPDPPVSEVPATRTSMKNKEYLNALSGLQLELAKLQEWIRARGLQVVVLFEGRTPPARVGRSRPSR